VSRAAVAPAGQPAVGAEHVRRLDLVAVERAVLLTDRDLLERRVVEAVGVPQPGKALRALLELRARAEREARDPAQVADRGQSPALGEVLRGGDRVDVLERRLLADRLPALRIEAPGQLVGLGGRAARVGAARRHREGDAQVLGIAVDRAALELAVDDLRGADVPAQPDVDALRLQRLAIELAHDERLGEVLGPQRDDKVVALRLDRSLAVALVVAARGEQRHERRQKQRERRAVRPSAHRP
jgi:hypothetical protein